MNKDKIKELMQRAGTDTSGKWMGVDHAEVFAQLIVAECVDVLMLDHAAAKGQHNYYHVTANKIKEHFGVEE